MNPLYEADAPKKRAIGVRLALVAGIVLAGVVAGACGPDDNASGRSGPRRGSTGTGDASDAGPSPTSTVDSRTGPSCANAVRDGDETDVDCGGSVCPPCANGRACATARDCASVVCTDGKCSTGVGCSDGTREGFASQATFPDIAACAGAWSLPGLRGTTTPACGHGAGNDSANPTGSGCNVADLCQPGWHVCETPAAVAAASGGTGCAGGAVTGGFFAIRQSGSGGALCGVGSNDLFGCGDVGAEPDPATCAPLDRFSGDLCAALPSTWACGADGGDEQGAATKSASEGGGVLCCRN